MIKVTDGSSYRSMSTRPYLESLRRRGILSILNHRKQTFLGLLHPWTPSPKHEKEEPNRLVTERVTITMRLHLN